MMTFFIVPVKKMEVEIPLIRKSNQAKLDKYLLLFV